MRVKYCFYYVFCFFRLTAPDLSCIIMATVLTKVRCSLDGLDSGRLARPSNLMGRSNVAPKQIAKDHTTQFQIMEPHYEYATKHPRPCPRKLAPV
jgi:hypothetical protein